MLQVLLPVHMVRRTTSRFFVPVITSPINMCFFCDFPLEVYGSMADIRLVIGSAHPKQASNKARKTRTIISKTFREQHNQKSDGSNPAECNET